MPRWALEPEDPQPHLQTVLFAKVVQALLAGKPAEAFLDEQRQRHLEVMHQLTAARRVASRRDSMLLDYQLFHIEADLRWIDHASVRLEVFSTPTTEIEL